jgi:hypothetical protein
MSLDVLLAWTNRVTARRRPQTRGPAKQVAADGIVTHAMHPEIATAGRCCGPRCVQTSREPPAPRRLPTRLLGWQ